jgi:hypothetical protein
MPGHTTLRVTGYKVGDFRQQPDAVYFVEISQAGVGAKWAMSRSFT